MKPLLFSFLIFVALINCKSSDVEVKREKVDFTTLEELSIDTYTRIVTYSPNENGVRVPDIGRPNFIVINDESIYRKSIERIPEKDKPLPEIDFTKYTLLFAEAGSADRPEILLEKEDGRIILTIKTKRTGEYGHHGVMGFSFSAIVPKVDEANVKYEFVAH